MMNSHELQYRTRDGVQVITEEEKPLFDRLVREIEISHCILGKDSSYVSVQPDDFNNPKTWTARVGYEQQEAARPYDALKLLGESTRAQVAERCAKFRVSLRALDTLLGEPKMPAPGTSDE